MGEGLRNPIYKSGAINDRNNYRSITVLSVFTKLFETAVNNRISFINDAFKTTDIFNGGFLEGSRTADDVFILQGLIERQLILEKSLYICMVAFSKAFHLVNKNILFFKLIRAGFHGKVIDTLRSLYRKIEIGLQKQLNGLLSFCANNCMIVNEIKTKAMFFGPHPGPLNIHLNGHPIETVSQYKYLGNIITATSTLKGDIFRNNSSYLCNQARKAIFGLKHKLNSLGTIPPRSHFKYLRH